MNRILVVDDSLSVRKVLERLLAIHADVTVAVSAEDALEQLVRSPLPDLLISDVLMPGMSGLDLTRTLRQRSETAALPIVLISGILDDQLMQEAREARVQGVVRKPFTAEALLPVISEALSGPARLAVPGVPAASPSVPPLDAGVRSPGVAGAAEPGASRLPAGAGVLEQVLPPAAAPAAPPVHVPDPAPEPVSAHDELMAAVLRKPGVLGVMVTTSGGEPLGFDGTLDLPAEDLAMYARFLANTAGVLGGRLGMPEQKGLQIDFAPRTLLILPLRELLLVCLLTDANSGSMIRFTLRRFLEA